MDTPRDVRVRDVRSVPIDSLKPHPRNARRGAKAVIEDSVDAHGVFRIIGVQKSTGFVIYGKNTWAAAKVKGRNRITVVFLDVDDDEAERIRVIDNRSSDLATYDEALQAQVLKDLAASERGLEGTGYDDATVVSFLASVGKEPVPVEDVAPRRQVSRDGDVWQLGDHRLVCGAEDLEVCDAMLTEFQRVTGEAPLNERTGRRRNFI